MGDMGDFAQAVRASSARHKNRIAEGREERAAAHFPKAAEIAQTYGRTLVRVEGSEGRYQMTLPTGEKYDIWPYNRRVNQLEGKKRVLSLPNLGIGWLIDVASAID